MIKSKILIGVMALALVGGIGSAFALTQNKADGTGTSPAFDEAIYLYWDSESTGSVGMTNIPSVSVNTPVYRYLTVAPKTTKSVTGQVKLTFTLAADTEKTATGLHIDVYKTASLATDSTVAGLIEGVSAAPSLTKNAASGYTVFDVESGKETKAYYAIKVVYDGGDPTEGKELGATVSISQEFLQGSAA